VHTIFKLNGEIKFGGLASIPDITLVLLGDVAINDGHSTKTEVSWNLEFIFHGSFSPDWEHNLVVRTNVTLGIGSAKLLIGDLSHSLDILFTVALTRWLLFSILEILEVGDSILVKLEGLDEDRSIHEWISSNLSYLSFLVPSGRLWHTT